MPKVRAFFGHECCIGGSERGNGGSALLEHYLFVDGGVSQFFEIVLDFLVLNGLSVRLVSEPNTRLLRSGGPRYPGSIRAAKLTIPVVILVC